MKFKKIFLIIGGLIFLVIFYNNMPNDANVELNASSAKIPHKTNPEEHLSPVIVNSSHENFSSNKVSVTATTIPIDYEMLQQKAAKDNNEYKAAISEHQGDNNWSIKAWLNERWINDVSADDNSYENAIRTKLSNGNFPYAGALKDINCKKNFCKIQIYIKEDELSKAGNILTRELLAPFDNVQAINVHSVYSSEENLVNFYVTIVRFYDKN